MADIKEKVEATRSIGWTMDEVQELVRTIRLTCLNLGYFIGLGGDVLGGPPSNRLELVFTPGDPKRIAEVVSNGMKNAYIYVNEANEERLLKWLTKLWNPTKVEEDNPVITFSDRAAANSGGEMPVHIGKDSNNSYVLIRKVQPKPQSGDVRVFPIGKERTIEVRVLPTPKPPKIARQDGGAYYDNQQY